MIVLKLEDIEVNIDKNERRILVIQWSNRLEGNIRKLTVIQWVVN